MIHFVPTHMRTAQNRNRGFPEQRRSPIAINQRLFLHGFPQLPEQRMTGSHALGRLGRAPVTVDACSTARTLQLVVAVALVLEASAVLDGVDELSEQEPPHCAFLVDLAVGDFPWVGTVV